VSPEVAREAMALASHKIGLKTKFIVRRDINLEEYGK
jgi:ribosomal protein L16/L10AE